MRRKRKPEEHDNLERWLITYADLITLLLAFFIMMYTFSKQDSEKYREVTGHLKTIFTGGLLRRIARQFSGLGAFRCLFGISRLHRRGEKEA